METLSERICPNAYTVTMAGDAGVGNGLSGDLRYCINQANADKQADTITIDTTQAGDSLTLTKGALTILGAKVNDTIQVLNDATYTIDANNQSNVFNVAGGCNVVINGITIDNGKAANGGGIINAGNLTLFGVMVESCTASQNGGGIYNTGTLALNSGSLVYDSVSNGSQNPTTGGGLSDFGGSLTSSNESFDCDTAFNGSGGGIFIQSANATISQGSIYGNEATGSGNLMGYGGGIYISAAIKAQAITVTLDDTSISTNTAAQNGGGIYQTATTALTVNIQNKSKIAGNSAVNGGGIYDNNGQLTFDGTSVVSSNTVTGLGTGIYKTNAAPAVVGAVIWGGGNSEYDAS